uniref:POTRA domain-containing protein n=1 Tax=Helminthora furcellata TaxID=1884666 RepID=A0A1G4NR82_9FLOR|nr:Hypothetical protein ORF_4 [Helminthora furcellata]SCW21125.1 Hypothetical protein ORF_4 [Helminthora furcellata]SCW23985.1 Hypothetical protein ORF_4 [Helminthora furcellata]
MYYSSSEFKFRMKLPINNCLYFSILRILQTICHITYLIISANYLTSSFNNKSILAFNYAHFSSISMRTSYVKSQEIIIHGLDNSKLRHKIIHTLEIDLNTNNLISRRDLKIWIRKLKLSGMFQSVQVKYYQHGTHQIIYLDLIANPILKEVIIVNFSKKMISKAYIQSIFYKQIGLPINFTKIEESRHFIKQWYNNQGYTDISSQIKYSHISCNIIEIDIIESLIHEIQIIIIPHADHMLYSQKLLLNYWLKSILEIDFETPINIRKLEKGIIELQNDNIIQHGYYKIKKHQLNKLLLYIQPLNNRSTYIFSKKNIITSNFLESIESFSDYSFFFLMLNKDLCSFIFSEISKSYWNLLEYNNFHNSVYAQRSRYDFMFYPSFLHTVAFTMNNYYKYWYRYDSKFIMNNNFGFSHYLRYLDRYNSNISVNFSLPKSGPLINLKYNFPFIKILPNLVISCTANFINTIYLHERYFGCIGTNDNSRISVYPKNSLFHYNTLFFSTKYNLSKTTKIYNNINSQHLISKSLLFNNHVRFNKLNDKFLITGQYSYFTKKYVHNYYKFIKHKVGFNLPLFSHKYIFFYPDLYNFEITHLIPSNYTNNNFGIHINKTIQQIRKQYFVNKQKFVLYAKYISLRGQQKDLPLSEQYISIGPDKIRGYTKENYLFPYSSSNYKLEYYLPYMKNNIIYIFLDYLKNETAENSNLKFTNYLHQIHGNHNRYLKISYGFGLKIMTPIKQIPPLRLEYGYNISHSQCLHLRVEQEY